MKILMLIFVAISVGVSDRLDRTYLPPPGSKFAGGSPGSILGPLNASNNFNKDGLDASANVDFMSQLEKSQNQPLITALPPFSDHGNRYQVPTTSDVFTQTTTYPPVIDDFSNEPSVKYKEHDYESEKLLPLKEYVTGQTNINYSPNFQARAKTTNNINEKPIIFSKKLHQSFDLIPNQDLIPFENLHLQENHNTNANRVPLKFPSRNLSQPPSGFVGQSSRPTLITPENYRSFGKSNNDNQNQENNLMLNNSPDNIQRESDGNAVIRNFKNILTPEGDFLYNFDTSNGIHAFESGSSKDGVKAKGAFSYIGDDGKNYSITYTADENGYLPQGDHLPTPPPIPDAILKVIEEANKDKEAGIFHDGSYDDEKYGYKNYEKLTTKSKANMKHDYELKNLPMKKNYETGKDKVSSDMDDINSHKYYTKNANGVKSNNMNNTFGTELTHVEQYNDINFPMNNQENAEVLKKKENLQHDRSSKEEKTNVKLEEQSPDDMPSKIVSNLNQKLLDQSTNDESRNIDISYRYPITKAKNSQSFVDDANAYIANTQKNPITSESDSEISYSGDNFPVTSQRYPDLESRNLIPSRLISNSLQHSSETGYQYIPPQNPFSQDFSGFQSKKPLFMHTSDQNRNAPFMTPNASFKKEGSSNDIEFSKGLEMHHSENASQFFFNNDITIHTTENIERQRPSSEISQTPEADFQKTQHPIFGQRVHSAHENNRFKSSKQKYTNNGNKNNLSPTSIPTESKITEPEITHRIEEYPLSITTVPFSTSQSDAKYDKNRPSSINRNNGILKSGVSGKDSIGIINVPSTTYRPMYLNKANKEAIQPKSQKFDQLTTAFGSLDNNQYSTERTSYKETSSSTFHSEDISPFNQEGYHTYIYTMNGQKDYSSTTYKPYEVTDRNLYTYMTTPMGSQHETTIGEDFSGPKQPHYFDPITGYHY